MPGEEFWYVGDEKDRKEFCGHLGFGFEEAYSLVIPKGVTAVICVSSQSQDRGLQLLARWSSRVPLSQQRLIPVGLSLEGMIHFDPFGIIHWGEDLPPSLKNCDEAIHHWMKKGDYETASSLLDEALIWDSSSGLAVIKRAEICLLSGKFQEGFHHLKDWEKRWGKGHAPWKILGSCLLAALDDPTGSFRWRHEAMHLPSSDPEQIKMAELYGRLFPFPEISKKEKALLDDLSPPQPWLASMLNTKGLRLARRGAYGKALSCYQAASTLAWPEARDRLRFNAVLSLLRMGSLSLARQQFEAISPDSQKESWGEKIFRLRERLY